MPEPPSRNDGVTIACPICARRFRPSGRRRFCSDACRQAAWRRRQPTAFPPIPARIPRAATLYVCPTCDARYLGEQRCPDCSTFCRRLGPGGACPHCEEPLRRENGWMDTFHRKERNGRNTSRSTD
jgi:hypothetical protein